ncbi:MAG TPA: ferritin-like domain-containing protein [Nannocystaceae bacterium]|nr:ferritin-like domain-containing protein [Nannocystaceae bacterium]
MQRKYAVAMGALFTALIEGCVARVPVGSDEDSGDESESGESSADATGTSTSGPNTSSTSGPMTSTSGPDTWPTTTDPTIDPTSNPCGDSFDETSEIDASLVAGYDVGQSLPLDICTMVCMSEQYYDDIQSCVLTGLEVDSQTSEGDTGEGSTTESGGDRTATVECTYFAYCGEGGRRSAGLVSRGDCESSDGVAAWFASMAHSEAASVTSFLRLQEELAEHGAPAELRARLWEAARDEVRHARAMRRLARENGVEPKTPEHVKIDARDLEAIARENAVEGCVAETWSALLCAWQARHCPSPELAEILRGIADDETRHAELAWAIDAWARARLDDDACARIDVARREAAEKLVAMASELGGLGMRDALGLPAPKAARTLASGLQAALWA